MASQPGILARATETELENVGEKSTPVGLLYIKVENVGTGNIVFNRVTLEPGREKIYPFVGKGYESMTYSVDSSKIRLTYII